MILKVHDCQKQLLDGFDINDLAITDFNVPSSSAIFEIETNHEVEFSCYVGFLASLSNISKPESIAYLIRTMGDRNFLSFKDYVINNLRKSVNYEISDNYVFYEVKNKAITVPDLKTFITVLTMCVDSYQSKNKDCLNYIVRSLKNENY